MRIKDHMKDKIYIWIAWHLPRTLVMWCAIRVHAYATQGKWSGQIAPELTAMDSVQRWVDRSKGEVT